MKFVDQGEKRLKFGLNAAVFIWALWVFSWSGGTVQKTSAFENLMIDAFAPLQKSLSLVQRESSSLVQNYLVNFSAHKENVLLKRQVEDLKRELFTFEEIAKENKRLKNLLKFVNDMSFKRVLAQVVAWDTSSDFRVLRVNKGINQGVKLQSTVVTSSGLVGYVYRLTDNFADVLTILDANSRVDGIISRIRSHGIIEGYSADKCVMKYVIRTEPVILHDVVLTSGLGNIYPKGIKVGEVTRIERESYGIVQRIEVTPFVDFRKLEEVAILVSDMDLSQKKEWDFLEGRGEALK